METIRKGMVLIVSLLILTGTISAETKSLGIERERAKVIIRRTAFVILAAHKEVKEHRVFTGFLARSINHQRYARMLFLEGKYLRAIYHSRRARFLAVKAIEANKGVVPTDIGYTREDEGLMRGAPNDDELDKNVAKALPDAPTKDEDVIEKTPDVDMN